jgi:hypothetical protein
MSCSWSGSSLLFFGHLPAALVLELCLLICGYGDDLGGFLLVVLGCRYGQAFILCVDLCVYRHLVSVCVRALSSPGFKADEGL